MAAAVASAAYRVEHSAIRDGARHVAGRGLRLLPLLWCRHVGAAGAPCAPGSAASSAPAAKGTAVLRVTSTRRVRPGDFCQLDSAADRQRPLPASSVQRAACSPYACARPAPPRPPARLSLSTPSPVALARSCCWLIRPPAAPLHPALQPPPSRPKKQHPRPPRRTHALPPSPAPIAPDNRPSGTAMQRL